MYFAFVIHLPIAVTLDKKRTLTGIMCGKLLILLIALGKIS